MRRISFNLVHTVTRWIGFLGSWLTLILGIYYIYSQNPYISISEGRYWYSDVQQLSWRTRLFTLNPNIAIDLWTPFLFGLIGIIAHMNIPSIVALVSKNFRHYFVFNLLQGLFATIAYCGLLGVLFSLVVFLCALLCFINLMFEDGPASLGLEWHKNKTPFEA